MAYPDPSTVNASEGIYSLFLYINNVTSGVFSNMLLFSLFVILMLGSYFYTQKAKGRGDFSVSFAIAGFVTTVVSFFMYLMVGIVNFWTVLICFCVAIIGVALLLFSGKDD